MLLKAPRYHRVPVGSLLFALLTEVKLVGALSGTSLEGSGRKCELRDTAGNRRAPLEHHQKLRASQEASNSLSGSHGQMNLLKCCLLHCWYSRSNGSGGMMGTLWDRAHRGGSPLALYSRGWSAWGRRSQLAGLTDPG